MRSNSLFFHLCAASLLSGIALALHAADDLPRRGALGAQLANEPDGVRVMTVLPGTTAQALELASDDVLREIDGRPIRALDDVFAWVASSRSGASVSIAVDRKGKRLIKTGETRPRPMETEGPDYRVEYGSVRSAGNARLRTLVSVPNSKQKAHPALMLIQGVTLSSVDTPLTDANPYARLLGPFARAGYVTMRVDKAGSGDSEGGPGKALDFETELAGYRAALTALRARADVDPTRIYLIGHSMGGIWAPLIAKDNEVAGIVVYGTVFRTWNEYDLENARRQFRLGGESASDIHAALTGRAALNSALLIEGLSPAEIEEQRPSLAPMLAENIADGLWNGRSVTFWQQLAKVNVADTWAAAKTPVLALHGAADFVAAQRDHELLAEAVRANQIDGQFVLVEGSDHGFGAALSERAAFAALGKPGIYSGTAARHIDRWLQPKTELRAFDARDLTLDRLPAGTGAGRTMDASLGDVDGDGDDDLLLAKEFARNVLLLREGERFVPSEDALPASDQDSEDAVLGDFDGDGDLDVVFPSEDTSINEYLVNDGSGRFSTAPHPLPSETTSNAGVAGDLDGDGDLDLVLSRNTERELVLLNDDSGRFSDVSKVWMPDVVDITQDLKLADLDGDGDLDLVAGNEPGGGGRNRLYRNEGERFVEVTETSLPAPENPEETRKVAVGDIDGDKDLDLYFANVNFTDPQAAQPRLLLNDGKGRFVDGSKKLPAPNAGSVLDAQFVDLDGDSDSDLLLGTLGQGTRLLLQNGNGSAFEDKTPDGYASGEPASLGIVALQVPGMGVFESAFDRGDRMLSL